jgi:thioesterase domain-containing protein
VAVTGRLRSRPDNDASVELPKGVVAIRHGGSKPPLFLIHGTDGSLSFYDAIVQHFPADQPVFGIEPRAMHGFPPDFTIESMAANYLPLMRVVCPEGPYSIAGHSLSGLIAYEMAYQLESAGLSVRLVGLIDTYLAGVPGLGMADAPAPVRTLFGERLRHHVRTIVLGPNRRAYWTERWRRYRHKARLWAYGMTYRSFRRAGISVPAALQDLEQTVWYAARTYVPHKCRGQIVLFRSEIGWPWLPQDPLRGWGSVAGGGVTVREVPGNHLSMITEPGVSVLAGHFVECLAGSELPDSRATGVA